MSPQMQKQHVTQRPFTIKTLNEVGTEGVTSTGGRPRATSPELTCSVVTY